MLRFRRYNFSLDLCHGSVNFQPCIYCDEFCLKVDLITVENLKELSDGRNLFPVSLKTGILRWIEKERKTNIIDNLLLSRKIDNKWLFFQLNCKNHNHSLDRNSPDQSGSLWISLNLGLLAGTNKNWIWLGLIYWPSFQSIALRRKILLFLLKEKCNFSKTIIIFHTQQKNHIGSTCKYNQIKHFSPWPKM